MPSVLTNDGVRLNYREAGDGRPVVLVPGIAQSTAVFARQVEGLSERYRVVVYDQRGHGESDKPPHGYRVARLAKDLADLLAALGLREVTLLGWSLGCSVAWSYYEMFGDERLDRLVLVDGSVALCRRPEMTAQDIAGVGAVWDAAEAMGVVGALREDPEGTVRSFTAGFLADQAADREWIVRQALAMPGPALATLMCDYVFGDWRDVVPRIALPTLVVGADRSHVPVSVAQWLHRAIPGAELAVLRNCAHLMFYEDPDAFNERVCNFIG